MVIDFGVCLRIIYFDLQNVYFSITFRPIEIEQKAFYNKTKNYLKFFFIQNFWPTGRNFFI